MVYLPRLQRAEANYHRQIASQAAAVA